MFGKKSWIRPPSAFFIIYYTITTVVLANVPQYFHWEKTSNNFTSKTIQLNPNVRSLRPDFETFVYTVNMYNRPIKGNFEWLGGAKQDIIVNDIMGGKENGYFVDLAANHWYGGSNTYVLENYKHWKGVCIEANPMYLEGLLSNRKCKIFTNAAGSTNGETVKFDLRIGDEYAGGIVGEQFDNKKVNDKSSILEVTTATLQSMLEFANAPVRIDYLSLDVEGAEYYVMKSFDFNKYIFCTVTIERPPKELHHLMVRMGYIFVAVIADHGEVLYIHHTFNDVESWVRKYHSIVIPRYQDTSHNGNHSYHPLFLLHPSWNGTVQHWRSQLPSPPTVL